jgi:hypothetical protein
MTAGALRSLVNVSLTVVNSSISDNVAGVWQVWWCVACEGRGNGCTGWLGGGRAMAWVGGGGRGRVTYNRGTKACVHMTCVHAGLSPARTKGKPSITLS